MKYDTPSIGKKFRDISLPKVTNDMIKNMFTLENLCLPPGFPISVPTKHFAKPPIHLTIELVHQMNKQQAENEEGSTVEYILTKLRENDQNLHKAMYTRLSGGINCTRRIQILLYEGQWVDMVHQEEAHLISWN
jgi:hypothetical protein